MKAELTIVLCAALGLSPLAAHAAETYAGVSAGEADQEVDMTILKSSDKTTAFKLYGGYRFTKHFGLEGGLVQHGKATLPLSGTIMTSKPRSFYVAATGSIPLTEQFSLTGKVGASYNRTKSNNFGFNSRSLSNTSWMAGVGVALKFTPTITGVVDYERFDKLLDRYESTVVSAGVQFAF